MIGLELTVTSVALALVLFSAVMLAFNLGRISQ